MTEQDVIGLFEKHSDEYIEFERIAPNRRLHRRADICGFLLIDRLIGDADEAIPGTDIICAAEHDEFFLAAGPESIAANATEEDVIDLLRCGVRYDSSHNGFAMFA